MNHPDRDDFDQQLRKLAPAVAPRSEFRKNLRIILRTRMVDRKSVKPMLPLMVVICLSILFNSGYETELISTDFRLQPHGVTITGQQVVRSYLGDAKFSKEPSNRVEDLEAIYEMETAHSEDLATVTGWTLAGQTIFITTYEYEYAGVVHAIARMSKQPPTEPQREHFAFLAAHEEDFVARVSRHEVEYLGGEDRLIDTVPVRFGKWLFSSTDWGPVIYWEGFPLPPLMSQ